jgi:signal transduction histidine kinase
LYYYNAKNIILLAAGNQLESLSSAKKNRIEGLIKERQVNLTLVQNRLFNTENLFFLNKYGTLNDSIEHQYKRLVQKNISQIANEMHQFKTIHVLDKSGIAIASTDSGAINFNFGLIDFVQNALEGNNVVSSILDRSHKNSYLCLAGPLYHLQKLQGTILIETNTLDLMSLTSDYTGLGKTGETVIAQSITDTLACYITPTRHNSDKANVFLLNPKDTQAVFLALAGKEQLMLEALDNDGDRVVTSYRYIAPTKWAVITKIDLQELLEPVEKIKWMIIKVGSGTLLVLFAISLLLAGSIVSPIKRISKTAKLISEGNWEKRVDDSPNNELGELGASFNKMTDSLIESQNKLNEKISQLDKSNASLEKFAFVVSHDLKSPLNSSLGLVELLQLQEKSVLSKDGKDMMQILRSRLEHMRQMIAGILDFSRLNIPEPSRELIDLNALIDNITANYSSDIEFIRPFPLPQIFINPVLASQLFQNLIDNAVKYNINDDKKVVIGQTERSGDFIFYVQDNGIGIEPMYADKIFDLFQTVGPKHINSSGIGLAIVKKIVENYSGKIWFEPNHNQGTTFLFTLPDAIDSTKNKKTPEYSGAS